MTAIGYCLVRVMHHLIQHKDQLYFVNKEKRDIFKVAKIIDEKQDSDVDVDSEEVDEVES